MQASSTADATSNVVARLNEAVDATQQRFNGQRLQKLNDFQKRVAVLKKRGFLKRQEYGEAKSADFRKLFMKQG